MYSFRPRRTLTLALFTSLCWLLPVRRAEAEPAEAPVPPPEEAPRFELRAAPGDGATIWSERFSLNVKTRIQLRYQLHIPEADDAGERDLDQLANVSTARLVFSGHLFVPELTYTIQLAVAARDFRDGAVSPIFDAYLDWKGHRDASVRVGQFFVPFDRLRTIREWALQTADRPQPITELNLDRDVGVMLYSESFLGDRSPFAYRLGAFGGKGTNLTRGSTPGGLLVGRLELRPLGPIDDDVEGDLARRKKPALALGVGFAHDFRTDRLRATTGPNFVGGTTSYTYVATDLVFKWYGFAFQAEYLQRRSSKSAIRSVDDEGAEVHEYPQSGRGYVLQASYVFDPPIEIVARIAQLWAIGREDAEFYARTQDRGDELAVGTNYYFSGHKLKVQADWIARMPRGYELAHADHLVHVQIDATF